MQPKQSTEDMNMFYAQHVCGKCYHRFTTEDDARIHISIAHEQMPTPQEMMDMLETILITVSKDYKDDVKKSVL